MRIGFGYDSHRLVEKRLFILGGIEIPADRGLLGHSDADVLLHAICDAILGAIGERDIGWHFPDNDPAYKNISSLELLIRVRELAYLKGYIVNNVDSTLVLEKPRLKKHIPQMIENIAKALRIEPGMVNVKASTNEGMGFTGRGEGVVAYSVVTVNVNSKPIG